MNTQIYAGVGKPKDPPKNKDFPAMFCDTSGSSTYFWVWQEKKWMSVSEYARWHKRNYPKRMWAKTLSQIKKQHPYLEYII